MIIIMQISYPPQSSEELGKRFLSAPALPDFIKISGPYISSVIHEGIKSITIYEFDESKYGEALNFIVSERVAKYLTVPGLSYSLNHWLEAKDALHLVGLA